MQRRKQGLVLKEERQEERKGREGVDMRYRVLVVLLAVLLLPGLTLAAEIQGRVVGVHDVLTSNL